MISRLPQINWPLVLRQLRHRAGSYRRVAIMLAARGDGLRVGTLERRLQRIVSGTERIDYERARRLWDLATELLTAGQLAECTLLHDEVRRAG